MPDVITCTKPKGTTAVAVVRASTGLTAPGRPAQGCEPGATARETCPLVATGNPCASRMIPLESPVPEIGPPGSESGGRKRAHGNRSAARLRKHRMSHRPLPATRLPSTLPPSRKQTRRRVAGASRGCAVDGLSMECGCGYFV